MAREIHIGTVSRTNDPNKLGRIRVKCQTLATGGSELAYWVKPCFPFTSTGSFGWFMVPEVGSEVELEVNASHDEDEVDGETFILAPDIHYRAGLFSPNNPPPAELTKNYPKRRGFKSPSGHILIMDDTSGSELLLLQDAIGSFLKMSSSGDTALVPHGNLMLGAEGLTTVPGPTSEGVVNGHGIDPFTGSTYGALGNASTKVFAKK